MRAAGATAFALALALAGCAEPTQLVVHVWTNMRVPEDVDQLRIRVERGGEPGAIYENVVPLAPGTGPDYRELLSFGAGPAGEDTSRRVRVLVDAIRGGTNLFTTEVRTGFAHRKKLRLDVYVAARCVAQSTTCGAGETCGLDGCVSPDVPVESLPPADSAPTMPSDPRRGDGGAALDGGAPDAAGMDASGSDAAGAVPPPRPIWPPSGSVVRTLAPTLRWDRSAGYDRVDVEVATPGAGSSTASYATEDRSVVTVATLAGTRLWRVRGLRGATASAWSPYFSFAMRPATPARDLAWGSFCDVNGDGYADVVVGETGPGCPLASVQAALSNGDGTFRAPAAVASLWHAAAEVLVLSCPGDVDGDGYGDVVVGEPAEPAGGVVEVIRGGPTGLVSPPAWSFPFPVVGAAFGTAIAGHGDYDGDGYADFLASAPGQRTIVRYRGGPGGPVEVDRLPGSLPGFGTSLATGALDDDGYLDLAVGAPGDASTIGAVVAFRGTIGGFAGMASLMDPLSGVAGSFGGALSMGDLDRDGTARVVVLDNASDRIFAAEWPSGGAFSVWGSPIRAMAPLGLAANGDFTGDGHAEIAFFENGSPALYVYEAGVTGGVLGSHPTDMADGLAFAGDVNADGRDELVLGEPEAGQVRVIVSDGTGGTAVIVAGPSGSTTFGSVLAGP